VFAPVFVLGGIYIGIFTPSEAAAVMVIYAVIITIFMMKTLTWRELLKCILVGAEISSMILLIIVCARIFGAVTSQAQIAANLVTFINEAEISPIAILGLVSLMLFVFGMFLDSASILVITLFYCHVGGGITYAACGIKYIFDLRHIRFPFTKSHKRRNTFSAHHAIMFGPLCCFPSTGYLASRKDDKMSDRVV